MIKKFLRSISAVTAIGVFLCTNTYAFTLSEESATTQKGTLYGENVVAQNITGGETNDYAKVETSGNSMIFTPNTVTGNARGTIGKIEVPQSAIWEDSGCIEVTLDWKNEGTVKSGDWWYFGLIPETYNGTAVKEAPARDFMWKIFTVETAQPDGVVRSVKYVYDYSDSNIHLTVYTKEPDADYVKLKECDLNMAAAKGYKKIADIVPIVYFGNNKGSDFKTTISNIKITEKQTAAALEDIGGNYLQGDKKSVSYYLPEGYSSASLEFDGKTLVTFSEADDEYGCYKTELDFSKFEKGNNKALKLIVGGETAKEYRINIAELITEPSFTDVTGDYKSTDTISLEYKIPQEYESAVLKIGDSVIKSYEKTQQNGGEFEYELKLSDYDCIGEDIPISLTICFSDKEDIVLTSFVNISRYYPAAMLSDLEGEYFTGDVIDIEYTLPTDYKEASITVLGECVAQFNSATTPPGPGTIKAELKGNFDEQAEICLEVKNSEDIVTNVKKNITVYEIVARNLIMNENFENDPISMTMRSGNIETINGTKAFCHNFTQIGKFERNMLDKRNLSLSRDWFIELSYDVYLSEKDMETGIYLQDSEGTWWYGAFVLQKEGEFGVEYEKEKWYNIKYRVIPKHYNENGKTCVLVYVDGKYVGKAENDGTMSEGGTETKNIKQVSIEYRNGKSYSCGKLYIDNVKLSVAAPKYNISVRPLDKNGNLSDAMDCDVPAVKLMFNQEMNQDTITAKNIVMRSFNNTEVPISFTIDEGGKGVLVTATERLIPGSKYTLSIGEGVFSKIGVNCPEGHILALQTMEKGIYIENASVSGGVSSILPDREFRINVSLKNTDASKVQGRVFAVLYCGEQMTSINSIEVGSDAAYANPTITLRAPHTIDANLKAMVFFTSAAEEFAVTDMCVAE